MNHQVGKDILLGWLDRMMMDDGETCVFVCPSTYRRVGLAFGLMKKINKEK